MVQTNSFDELKTALSADYLLILPLDTRLHQWNERGESLFTLPEDNPVNREIGLFLDGL